MCIKKSFVFQVFSSLFKKKNRRVVAFIGKSGTGKSYRAKPLAKKEKADLIIDDGLLIEGDKILAGHSAKKEATFFAAIKVCLFDDNRHRDEVLKALQEKKHKRVLILGTSEKMINKILLRLSLPQPYKVIRIEEVSTQQEIADALRQRNMEGKHVIPLPSWEVKKNYPKIFYDKVRLFFKMPKAPVIANKGAVLFEKSVVRPEFFRREIMRVPHDVLSQNIKKYVLEADPNIIIKSIRISFEAKGYNIALLLDYPFYENIALSIKNLQKVITEKIENCDNTSVASINIVIDEIITQI